MCACVYACANVVLVYNILSHVCVVVGQCTRKRQIWRVYTYTYRQMRRAVDFTRRRWRAVLGKTPAECVPTCRKNIYYYVMYTYITTTRVDNAQEDYSRKFTNKNNILLCVVCSTLSEHRTDTTIYDDDCNNNNNVKFSNLPWESICACGRRRRRWLWPMNRAVFTCVYNI